MTAQPQNYSRRAFHYRQQVEAKATFRLCDQTAALAEEYGQTQAAAKKAIQKLAICDLSVTPRTGFKGKETLDWLSLQSVTLETASNQAYRQKNGELCAVLAPGEAMILSGFTDKGILGDGALVHTLDKKWDFASGVRSYHMPRQDSHFDFLLTGAHLSEMFAKICGVDLRPRAFAQYRIAQTSVARTNAVVIRSDFGTLPAFRLLGDSASSLYMWQVLLDAGAEFTIDTVGITQVESNIHKSS